MIHRPSNCKHVSKDDLAQDAPTCPQFGCDGPRWPQTIHRAYKHVSKHDISQDGPRRSQHARYGPRCLQNCTHPPSKVVLAMTMSVGVNTGIGVTFPCSKQRKSTLPHHPTHTRHTPKYKFLQSSCLSSEEGTCLRNSLLKAMQPQTLVGALRT